jgi:hypothetical protein
VKPVFPHFSPHQLQHLGNEAGGAGGAGIRVTGCNGSKPQKDRNVMYIYIYIIYTIITRTIMIRKKYFREHRHRPKDMDM